MGFCLSPRLLLLLAATATAILPGCRRADPPASPAPQPLAAPPEADAPAPPALPVDPTVVAWAPLPDRTNEAQQRTPWDNFATSDTLARELTYRVRAPTQEMMATWKRFEASPFEAIVATGAVDYWIISKLYRDGVLSRDDLDGIFSRLEALVDARPDDAKLQANLFVALIHLGLDEKARSLLDASADAPCCVADWDFNFYAGTLLFRYGEYARAVTFLQRAHDLAPDAWSRLWLRMALAGEGEADQARLDSIFRFGAHVAGARAAEFPFRDVADKWGMRRWHLAGAVAFADFDGDSYVDLVANGVYANPERYRFEPGRGFVRVDDPALADIHNVPSGAAAVDLDNDGFRDLYLPQAAWFSAGPNRTMRNMAGAGFENVSMRGDNAVMDQNSCGVGALDFDRDGLVDLAVTGTQGGTLRLLRNKGEFTLEDVSDKAGILPHTGTSVGLAIGDVDDDGWPDIFVNTFSPPYGTARGTGGTGNLLYINQRDGTFKEEGGARGVADGTSQGFAAWMFDYDNDGDLDILASNFARPEEQVIEGLQKKLPHTKAYTPSALYKNDGQGRFSNVAEAAGFLPAGVMGAQFIDFELDGDLDVVLGPGSHPLPDMQPLLFYRNDGGDRFALITPLDEPRYFGKFHGMAFADVDRDGDPDLYVNNGGVLLSDRWRDLFLENRTLTPDGGDASWLHLLLVGTKSNRGAVGARVRVHAAGRVMTQEVAAPQGFSSTNSPYLIFGLTPADRADRIEIRWPSGATQRLGPVAADQALVVTEGSDALRRVY